MSLGSIDGYTRVIAYMTMSARGKIEKRRLTAVRITYQGDIDHTALVHRLVMDIVVFVDAGIFGYREMGSLDRGICRYDLDIIGFLMAKRHFVTHQLILYRVL